VREVESGRDLYTITTYSRSLYAFFSKAKIIWQWCAEADHLHLNTNYNKLLPKGISEISLSSYTNKSTVSELILQNYKYELGMIQKDERYILDIKFLNNPVKVQLINSLTAIKKAVSDLESEILKMD
jgi:RNase adaptor protein for sRNA GlmZ degradation